MANKAQPLDPLESYFAATSLGGLIKSGVTLLKARRVRLRSEAEASKFNFSDFANQVGDIGALAMGIRPKRLKSRIQGTLVEIPQAHPGTGLDQPLGDGVTNALGPTGHDGHLPLEIDPVHLAMASAGSTHPLLLMPILVTNANHLIKLT